MDGWSFIGLTLVLLVTMGVALGLVVWVGRWLVAVVVGGLPWAIRTAFRWIMRRPPDTHGSAHWAREDERADLCTEAPGIVLGQLADGRPLIDASEAHVLVLGPTGSRKSRGVFVPTLERWPGSALVIDLKGELSTLTGEARKVHGDVAVFAPTLLESIKVNVMDWIRWDTDRAVGDCQRLAAALTTEGGAEDWRQDVRALLTAVLLQAKAEGYGHLAGALAWMTAATLDDRMQRLMASPSPVVRAQGLQLKSRSDRMRSLVWNAALATLGLWWDPVIARNTATSDLDLLSLPSGLRPCTVYVRLPEGDLLRLRPLLITYLEMFVGRLTDRAPGSQRHELLLALDEFAALGTLPTLQASAAYLRGYRTRLLVALQTLRQLRQLYGPDAPLAAQMKTWWCAAPSDPDDAKVISARLGTQTRARLALKMWSQGRPGELGITWLEAPQHGYIQRLGPQLQRRELFLCVVAVNTDT
jgi:type IV secretion system protein VirD4